MFGRRTWYPLSSSLIIVIIDTSVVGTIGGVPPTCMQMEIKVCEGSAVRHVCLRKMMMARSSLS